MPRDSSSSCLIFRTSFRGLTTLEMGKKHKQNLENSVFESASSPLVGFGWLNDNMIKGLTCLLSVER